MDRSVGRREVARPEATPADGGWPEQGPTGIHQRIDGKIMEAQYTGLPPAGKVARTWVDLAGVR
jgi:hypothetical protein